MTPILMVYRGFELTNVCSEGRGFHKDRECWVFPEDQRGFRIERSTQPTTLRGSFELAITKTTPSQPPPSRKKRSG